MSQSQVDGSAGGRGGGLSGQGPAAWWDLMLKGAAQELGQLNETERPDGRIGKAWGGGRKKRRQSRKAESCWRLRNQMV